MVLSATILHDHRRMLVWNPILWIAARWRLPVSQFRGQSVDVGFQGHWRARPIGQPRISLQTVSTLRFCLVGTRECIQELNTVSANRDNPWSPGDDSTTSTRAVRYDYWWNRSASYACYGVEKSDLGTCSANGHRIASSSRPDSTDPAACL